MRYGFHYFPDEAHYRALDLSAWLPELTALGAGWLTLVGSLSRAVPEHFVRGLKDAGIEPIIHIPLSPIRALDPEALRSLLQTYSRWGVQYVAVQAEPNSRASWTPADWGRSALVDRFLNIALPGLQMQVESGLTPVFPPLAPGGDYWDTAFLDAALGWLLKQPGASGLLDKLVLGAYLWAGNRAWDWGAGGRARWPQAMPYLTPPGTQDSRGFRAFEWYDEIARARLGRSLPVLCLAGGARLGDAGDPAFPPVDEARHAAGNLEIARALKHGLLPGYLMNVNFWLLAADPTSPFVEQAWYQPDGKKLSAVEDLKRIAMEKEPPLVAHMPPIVQPPLAAPLPANRGATQTARAPAATAFPAVPTTIPAHIAYGYGASPAADSKAAEAALPHRPTKPVYHYVLLPTFEWGMSDWHWTAVTEYVRAFRPTVGFSHQEAALARYVTIIGNEQGVTRQIEQSLRNTGCQVDRIAGKDGQETQVMLTTMAQRRQRFQAGGTS